MKIGYPKPVASLCRGTSNDLAILRVITTYPHEADGPTHNRPASLANAERGRIG